MIKKIDAYKISVVFRCKDGTMDRSEVLILAKNQNEAYNVARNYVKDNFDTIEVFGEYSLGTTNIIYERS